MNRLVQYIKGKWRRPKHKGVSGNFSTIVIITGIVIGSYIMTGGEVPNIYPTFRTRPIEGVPLEQQPTHPPRNSLNFSRIWFRDLPTPTPFPPDVSCAEQSIAFLIDMSGSMTFSVNGVPKIDRVKDVMTLFTEGLSDTALVAIYTFSDPTHAEPRERLPMSPYGGVKPQFSQIITELNPVVGSFTHMRDAFLNVDAWLQEARDTYPDVPQNLVFISDGIPQRENWDFIEDVCYELRPGEIRCYSPAQDPSLPPNLGDLIKGKGVSIYSIAIYTDLDLIDLDQLQIVLKDISSDAYEPYYNESYNANNIEDAMNSIKRSICAQ